MTTLALTATGGGRSAARGGAQFPAPAAMHVLALGAAGGTMEAAAILSARSVGAGGGRGGLATGTIQALVAWARGIGAARGTPASGAALGTTVRAGGMASGTAGGTVALTGHMAGRSAGHAEMNFGILALAARATLALAARAIGLLAMPLAGRASARHAAGASPAARTALSAASKSQGNLTPSARFLAPIEARNVLTLTVVARPEFAAPLAAAARQGHLARASAAFRAEMQARLAAGAPGGGASSATTALAGRGSGAGLARARALILTQALAGRTVLAASLRAAATLVAPPAAPPSDDINPYFEIDC